MCKGVKIKYKKLEKQSIYKYSEIITLINIGQMLQLYLRFYINVIK